MPPSDTLYVALDGDDAGAGSLASPFRTVAQGIRQLAPGGTLILRGGTYREALPNLSKTVTLQAYPDEVVWIKGSVVITDWKNVEDGWAHANWRSPFCQTCANPGIARSDRQIALSPEQVFVDGIPLEQVGQRGDLKHGTFFVDPGRAQLIVATDPTDRMVEVSVRETALEILRGAEGSVIRGIGFAHFSPRAVGGFSGMVKGDADRLTFEGNTFAHSAAVGLNIYGTDAIVRDNLFAQNGLAGFGSWRADRLVLSGNTFRDNNHEGFATWGDFAAAAGAKLTRSADVIIRNNRFLRNRAHGLWLDLSMTRAEIFGNEVYDSHGSGIFVELASHVTVLDNQIARSTETGLLVSGSNKVIARNNRLAGNGIAFSVIDDARINSDRAEIADGSDWVTRGVEFLCNIVRIDDPAQKAIFVRDFSGEKDARHMISRVDRNLYTKPAELKLDAFAEVWNGTVQVIHATFRGFQQSTRMGQQSRLEPVTSQRPSMCGA